MPALQLATQLVYRARKSGIVAADPQVKEDLRNVIGEVTQENIAALLIATVELAREVDVESESVLRAEMMRYRTRVRESEGL
jgi:hypothetical protein